MNPRVIPQAALGLLMVAILAAGLLPARPGQAQGAEPPAADLAANTVVYLPMVVGQPAQSPVTPVPVTPVPVTPVPVTPVPVTPVPVTPVPVTPVPGERPQVASFSSSAATITAGGEATLRWQASSATSVRIEPGVGDVTGQSSVVVRPAATTTYTLIASNAAGETRASVTVTVTPAAGPRGTFFLPGAAPTRNFNAAYDAAGTLHVAFVRHTSTQDRHELVYGQCAATANCDDPATWQTVVIHSGNLGTAQLKVTADGRPRLALQDEYTLTSVRLAYMACEASCLTSGGWQGISLGQGLSFSGAFLQHTDQRWFTIDAQGAPHMVVSTQEGSSYVTCRSSCATSGAGWSSTPLDTTGDQFLTTQLFNPVIQVGADGRPHILGKISRPELVYMGCAGDCTQAGSWRRLILASYNQPAISDALPVAIFPENLDLEIDRAGRIAVAAGGFTPGTNGPQRAYLFRCAGDCTSAESWGGRAFANTVTGGLNLVLDGRDQPYFLLATAVSEAGERLVELATCADGDCYDPNARWSARIISRSTEMEAEVPIKNPLATPAVCSIPTTNWEHASNELVRTPAGGFRLVTSAVGTSICQPGMDEWIDQWGTKKRGRTIDVWVITARARWTVVP